MSNMASLSQLPSRFQALVPVREENVKAAIGAVTALPTFTQELARLKAEVAGEHYVDLQTTFSGLMMDDSGFLGHEKGGLYTYTKHALAQAVSRIRPEGVVGMAGYLVACPPDLRSINYNFWHADRFGGSDDSTKGNKVILRIKDGEAGTRFLRAVVSQAYVAIDDVPVLSNLGAIVPDGAHLRSVRGDIRSRFDMVWPTQQREVRAGDTLMVALRLVNSETGASSVRLEPMVYHATNSSYYIIPRAGEDVAIRHIGEAKDRLKRAFNSVMSQIDPFISMMKASYNDSLFDQFKDQNQMWECLGKCFNLSDVKIGAIRTAGAVSPENPFVIENRNQVADAMVRAALDMDLESAEELQRAAGLLIMNGWRPLKRFVETE